ncbi:MAG: thioester reductase domain-containing protein [Proteobacteria bacterium]|nr:thioester reductase domain-containing protein [Pseudomonadota bacterium]
MNEQPVGIPGEVAVSIDPSIYPELKIQAVKSGQRESDELYLIGERAQKLNDGLFQYEETVPPTAWLGDQKIDFRLIENALMDHTTVEDCIVRIRESEKQGQVPVVYYTSGKSLSCSTFTDALNPLLPRNFIPGEYVPVTAIPRKDDGSIDEHALGKIVIIDQEAKERLYSKIKAKSGAENILVTVEEKLMEAPVLHLKDIMPIPQTINETEEQVPTKSASDEEDTGNTEVPALVEGGSLESDENNPGTLQDVIRNAAQQTPAKGICYYNEAGEKQLTGYPDLVYEAEKIMSGFRSSGYSQSQVVVFQLTQNKDFIENFWGCTLSGFTPVLIAAIESYDKQNPNVQKLADALDMFPEAIVVHDRFNKKTIAEFAKNEEIDPKHFLTIESLRDHEAGKSWGPCRPEDVATFFLTSGSTGKPKVVTQTQGSLVSIIMGQSQYLGFNNDDVSLNWMPLDHVGGTIMMHLRNVYTGCQQVQVATRMILKNPVTYLDLISEHKATDSWTTNASIGLVVDSVKKSDQMPWDLSSMKCLMNGGESLVPSTTREFLKLLAPCGLSDHCMIPAWGMAETSSGSIYSKSFNLSSTNDGDEFVNLGMPVPGLSIRIVDKNNQPLMENQVGELQVKGLPVTRGYHNNDKANREAFTEDGWFRTGDLGRINEGQLTLTGREKDVIIVAGKNYYSHEIEAVVEGLADIERSFTAACAVRSPGENTDQLAIFFHSPLSEQSQVLELMQAIRSEVLHRVGIFPKYLIPVQTEEIPKTEIGKIQRPKLKTQFENGDFSEHLKQFDLLSKNQNTLPNWFFQKSWRAKQLNQPVKIRKGGRILIFGDELRLDKQIARKLEENGQTCVFVAKGQRYQKTSDISFQINPERAADYQEMIDALEIRSNPIGQIIHLWNYDAEEFDLHDRDAIKNTCSTGVQSVMHCLQAIAKMRNEDRSLDLNVVASAATDVDGSPSPHPVKAALNGLIQTIQLELPWVEAKLIDLIPDQSGQNVNYLLQETQSTNKDRVVAYRHHQRRICRLKRVPFQQGQELQTRLKPQGNYLVTGGLGGIAQHLNRSLLQQYQANLLILGRSDIASDQDKTALLESLQKLPGSVRYESVDLDDVNSLKDIVETWESGTGSMDGVFHLAGVFSEQGFLKANKRHLDEALVPKLIGAINLAQLLDQRRDLLWVNFSSVNGMFGGSNVAAYSAASSASDALSIYLRNKQPFQTVNLAWSMWEEVGMSKGFAMKEFTKAAGFHMINPESGINSLEAGLCNDQQDLVIGLDSTKRNLLPLVENDSIQLSYPVVYQKHMGQGSESQSDKTISVTNSFRQAVTCSVIQVDQVPQVVSRDHDYKGQDADMKTASEQTETRLVTVQIDQRVIDIVREVVGATVVDINDNFFELGGNSMLAVQLLSRLEDEFKVELPLETFFQTHEQAVVKSIAARISGKIGTTVNVSEPATKEMISQSVDTVDNELVFIEEKVIEITKEVIGNQAVQATDNFFEIGGDSMLAVQLVSNLEEVFQIKLPLESLFQSASEATMQAIAARINREPAKVLSTKSVEGKSSKEPAPDTGNLTAREQKPAESPQPSRLSPVADPTDDGGDFMAPKYLVREMIEEADEISSTIPFEQAAKEISSDLQHVLLTGVTGFVGAYLLVELIQKTDATVYCLVRAKDQEAALDRVIDNLSEYGIWQESYLERFKVVVSDLAKPRLGLSDLEYDFLAERIQAIYHNGAMVNLVMPYYVVKPANVGSTEELIRMACKGPLKSIHFVSTMGVLSMLKPNESFPDDGIDMDNTTFSGYLVSKLIGERLLWTASNNGIPVTIHRIEQAAGESQSGASSVKDFFARQLKSFYEMKLFPEMYWNLTPVDYIAQAIMYISMDKRFAGKVYHISNHNPTRFTEFLEVLHSHGYDGRVATYEDLLKKVPDIKPNDPLYPFVGLLKTREAYDMMADLTNNPVLKPDCSNTLKALQGSGIICPEIDREIMETYLQYFNSSGLMSIAEFNK